MGWFSRDKKRLSEQEQAGREKTQNFIRYQAKSEQDVWADCEALVDGGIPSASKRRVEETVSKRLPWMSTLDIPDLFLAEELRIEPVVQVAGSCYYHAATDSNNRIYLDQNYDAGYLINAYYKAKRTALDRLRQEASLAGAHAVIAAEHFFSQTGTLVEFSIVGTAVTFSGVKRPKTPLVSPLSGEEFYKLFRIGFLPVSFALGYHYHCMPVGYRTQMINSPWNFSNQELTEVTERFMKTRENAIQRMRADARADQSVSGIVGVKMKTHLAETEILFYRGLSSGNAGFYMDGTYYNYGPDGRIEVPAYNAEFFATGAGVARIASRPLSKDDLSRYLMAVG